ncbi:extended synaptotagmin-related [Anaeramoeba flamelloides]|uniref:Extended synaptotagmin-related n=1 Tax=Anaeramoeba flamelloides TaxID=1746091 RepID=A0AAV7YL69_9EUKA|nr:extended synaptotagmin-related [Anaeramoeba flamelloides]
MINLYLLVNEIKNLQSLDGKTLPSPYVIVSLNKKPPFHQTETIINTQNPNFGQSFSFKITDPNNDSIDLSVYSSTKKKNGDLLGFTSLPLKQFNAGEIKKIILPLKSSLENSKNSKNGEINLVAVYGGNNTKSYSKLISEISKQSMVSQIKIKNENPNHNEINTKNNPKQNNNKTNQEISHQRTDNIHTNTSPNISINTQFENENFQGIPFQQSPEIGNWGTMDNPNFYLNQNLIQQKQTLPFTSQPTTIETPKFSINQQQFEQINRHQQILPPTNYQQQNFHTLNQNQNQIQIQNQNQNQNQIQNHYEIQNQNQSVGYINSQNSFNVNENPLMGTRTQTMIPFSSPNYFNQNFQNIAQPPNYPSNLQFNTQQSTLFNHTYNQSQGFNQNQQQLQFNQNQKQQNIKEKVTTKENEIKKGKQQDDDDDDEEEDDDESNDEGKMKEKIFKKKKIQKKSFSKKRKGLKGKYFWNSDDEN